LGVDAGIVTDPNPTAGGFLAADGAVAVEAEEESAGDSFVTDQIGLAGALIFEHGEALMHDLELTVAEVEQRDEGQVLSHVRAVLVGLECNLA
jgi:hypothetical protein